MGLPFDVARCAGVGAALCKLCRRTEAGDPERQWHVAPEYRFGSLDGEFVEQCSNFIEPAQK